MSHFACADESAHPLNQKQIATFSQLCSSLPGPKSFSNSAAIFQFPNAHYDVVRPGLALYGISPIAGKSAQELGLRPVMTLQTRLIAVRTFKKGASIGYGSQFICPEDMPIGIIAMGYGDGYPRTAQNGTPILVNNIRCQIVGRVSMDMITIDLRGCPAAKVGDHVVLWGNGLPIEEVAPHTAHIPYDLVTNVQQRVKFHWTFHE
jgi:alanine racemase